MNETAGRYALGVLCLLLVLGSLGLAAAALRRRFLPGWEGARARLVEAALGLVLLVWILEVLGAARLFRAAPIVVASVLVGIGVTWVVGAAGGKRSPWAPVRRTPDAGRWAVAAALLAAGLLLAEWAVPTIDAYDHGIRTFDSLWYHLPWAASFAQTGQVTSLRFTDVEYLTAFYPATAEMLHGLGIVLLGRDTISPGINLVWLELVLLAAWCLPARRDLRLGALLGAALICASPMMVFSQGGSAANDIIGIFGLLAAATVLLSDDRRRPAMALGGACAGLALGVKLSMVIPALALTVAAAAVPGRRRAAATSWLPGFLLAGGFWFLRNLIAVGNPVPWLAIPGLATPAPALQQHTGFSVVHYAGETHIWSSLFAPGLRSGLGPAWPVILVLALAGPLLCLSRDAGPRLRALAVVALVSLLGYLVTPESAAGPSGDPVGFAFNLRYSAPALVLCLAVLPLAPVLRGPRARPAVAGLLGALLAITLAESRLWPASHVAGAWTVAGAVAAVGLCLAVAIRCVRAPATRRWVLGGSICLTLALGGAAAGYALQSHYLRGRYRFSSAVSHLAPVWAYFRDIHRARVALAGTFGGFFSFPLYGLDASNRVSYVARRGPNGSFTPIGTCPSWRRAVNAGDFRYLVTTPARDPWHPQRLYFSPEASWTLGDPAAHVVMRLLAAGQPIYVFALRGRLDPASCATR